MKTCPKCGRPEREPGAIAVELSPEAARTVADLLPVVAQWALELHGQPATSPADVAELALSIFAGMIRQRAGELLTDADAGDGAPAPPRPEVLH